MMTKRESEKLIEDMKPELEQSAAWKCGACLFIVWLVALIGVQTSLEPDSGRGLRREAAASQVASPVPEDAGMVQTSTQHLEQTAPKD